MITLNLFTNLSDRNHLNKSLTPGPVLTGSLRDSSLITSPTILVESPGLIGYNYCQIPDFGRYYYIDEIESIRTGLWALHLRVDPLMSFRSQLLIIPLIVEASTATGADEYLTGTPWVARVKELTDIVNFPQGLPQEGEFILITAGG